MGELDNHIQTSATPLLRPDEQITVRAHVRRKPHLKKTYNEWLVAATTQRLLFFPAKETFSLNIEPGGWGKPFYVELRDLSAVAIGQVAGITTMRAMSLVPIEGRGPRAEDGTFMGRGLGMADPTVGDLAISDYRLSIHIPASTKGLDEQARFHGSYPEWLQQQVAGRVYWGPEEYNAEQAAAAAAQAALAEKQAKAEARRAAIAAGSVKAAAGAAKVEVFLRIYWLALLGAVLLLLGLFLIFFTWNQHLSYAMNRDEPILCGKQTIKLLRADESWIAAGQAPPTDCPEQKLVAKQEAAICPAALQIAQPYEKVCHSCKIQEQYPSGGKFYERGGKYWACPDARQHAELIAKFQKELDKEVKSQEEAYSASVGTGVAAGICLVGGIVTGILGLRTIRRRPKAGAAPAQPPQPGQPPLPQQQPPAMPGPPPAS